MKKNTTLLLLLIALFACNVSCTNDTKKVEENSKKNYQPQAIEIENSANLSEPLILDAPIDHDYSTRYSSRVFENEDKTWGYEILDDSSVFIRQENMPSFIEPKGFSTKKNAILTSELALYKLNKGFFPPRITRNDLDSLGVLD